MSKTKHTKRPAKRKPRRPSVRAQRRKREWRIRLGMIGGALGIAGVLALAVTVITVPQRPELDPTTVVLEADDVTGLTAAGYDAEQIANAAAIVQVGGELGMTGRDQAIAVMTAIGESSLRALSYGDWEATGVRNPDGTPTSSLGLFQQQSWWGSEADRLDPFASARLFYAALLRKTTAAERTDGEPSAIAHTVQVNSDPDHYAKFWDDAVRIVEALRSASN